VIRIRERAKQVKQAIYKRDGTLKRRYEVLQFMCDFADGHNGNSPSTNDVARHFNINQKTAWQHMVSLEDLGYISRIDNKWVIDRSEWIPPELDL
jgi:hypothetical protein